MANKTSIEWTEKTWNPIAGCRRVSPGCGKGASPAGCYAENIAVRFAQSEGKAAERWRLVVRYADCDKCGGSGAVGNKECPRCKGKKQVPTGWNGKFVEIPERLAEPLRWREPATVFVNSTSDLFGEGVSFEYIAAVFGVMAATPQNTYQILTKRAERLAEWFQWIAKASPDPWTECHFQALQRDGEDEYIHRHSGGEKGRPWPLPNVWIGVSVEDQQRADERIPHLLRVPAAVRFLSVEPMLGAIDLDMGRCDTHDRDEVAVDAEVGEFCNECAADGYSGELSFGHWLGSPDDGIDWVIVGGESGGGARPFALEWAAALSEQCRAAGVPYFFKQAGAMPHLADCRSRDGGNADFLHALRGDLLGREASARIVLADRKGGDVAELARLFPDFAAAGVFRRELPTGRSE